MPIVCIIQVKPATPAPAPANTPEPAHRNFLHQLFGLPTSVQNKPADSAQSSGNCAGFELGLAGCSSSHQIASKDKEWWDIGVVLPIPGVLEPQYQTPQDAPHPQPLIHPARHPQALGVVDLYPFKKWGDKNSYLPGFVTGVPVLGKSFWMPFFGVSENLLGWKPLRGRIPVDFVFGLVYLNQERIVAVAPTAPTCAGSAQCYEIGRGRTWKPLFGAELPFKAILSAIKLGTGGSSKQGGK
jgi:hypothetical protein